MSRAFFSSLDVRGQPLLPLLFVRLVALLPLCHSAQQITFRRFHQPARFALPFLHSRVVVIREISIYICIVTLTVFIKRE